MQPNDHIQKHYTGDGDLIELIADGLRVSGKDPLHLSAADLAPIDQFHIRGRKATLELGEKMKLGPQSHVLDVGSGLGGPARTLAQVYHCRVTGIDISESFCRAARAMSEWVGLSGKVEFIHGDAADLAFAPETFDAAMTIHAAMNISVKERLYAGVHRVLKSGGRFANYDVVQGEGGDVLFPVPWARDPSMSFLATPIEMRNLLTGAGFGLEEETDSSAESLSWFEQVAARMTDSGAPQLTFRIFLGNDFAKMAGNQVSNLKEGRIRTMTYVCVK